MREKKWIDCPVCGGKKCMHPMQSLSERIHPPGYPPLDIDGLDGQFCSICDEGFWSLKSERHIAREVARHMAQHDAARIVASELASVHEAAEKLQMSTQGIHKMMDEGRLRYVFAGGFRLPIRKFLTEQAKQRSRVLPS